jgi:hypothetical protein
VRGVHLRRGVDAGRHARELVLSVHVLYAWRPMSFSVATSPAALCGRAPRGGSA